MRYYARRAPALLEPEPITTSGSRSGVRYERSVSFRDRAVELSPLQVFRIVAPNLMTGNVVA